MLYDYRADTEHTIIFVVCCRITSLWLCYESLAILFYVFIARDSSCFDPQILRNANAKLRYAKFLEFRVFEPDKLTFKVVITFSLRHGSARSVFLHSFVYFLVYVHELFATSPSIRESRFAERAHVLTTVMGYLLLRCCVDARKSVVNKMKLVSGCVHFENFEFAQGLPYSTDQFIA